MNYYYLKNRAFTFQAILVKKNLKKSIFLPKTSELFLHYFTRHIIDRLRVTSCFQAQTLLTVHELNPFYSSETVVKPLKRPKIVLIKSNSESDCERED